MKCSEVPLGRLGDVPNNPACALRLYRGAIGSNGDAAAEFEALFAANGWPPAWRNGVFAYHHYHSTSHEALGIAGGSAEVQFGGPEGPVVAVSAGDAVWIPAGVAHKRISASPDFLVVGAYPEGATAYDLCRPESTDVAAASAQIAAVAAPAGDPVTGAGSS